MSSRIHRGPRPSVWIAMVMLLLLLAAACGPGEEPTPTATAAVAPTATPTAAPVPAAQPLATPTPTATPAPAAPPAKEPRKGGTLRWPTSRLPANFDEQLLVLPNEFLTNSKVYSNLLLNYVREEVECDLCSEWHLENSGKTMVFTITPGIKFHTGQELTSSDVKYALRMIMGEVDGIVSGRSGVIKEYVDTIDAPSRYQVRINLLRPSAFVPKILASAASVIYREGTTRQDLKKAPAGSGPFKIGEIVAGARWFLERNPDYFKAGQPYLDAVDITAIADTNTQVASFVIGKSDLWISPTYPAEQFLPKFYQLRDEGKVNVHEYPGGTLMTGLFMVVTKPPLNDIKLRKAINLTMDRERIGLAEHGGLPKHPKMLVYSEGSPYSTRPDNEIWNVVPGWGTGAKKLQEIEQAKQLLIDAGYTTGLDLEMMLRAPGGGGFGNASEQIQQDLAKVGVRAKIALIDTSVAAERQINWNYTMQYYGLRMVTWDPDELVGQYWVTGASRSYIGYSNLQVDKLYLQMSSETDPVKRRQLLRQIEDIVVVQDVAFASGMSTDTAAFWWKRLQGVTIGQTMHSPPGLFRSDRLWFSEE